jgi:hypothetical protein
VATAGQPVSELKALRSAITADDSFSVSREEVIPIGTNGIGKCSWPNRVGGCLHAQNGFEDPLYSFADRVSGFAYLKSHFAQSRKGFRRRLSAPPPPNVILTLPKSSLYLPYNQSKAAHEDMIMRPR